MRTFSKSRSSLLAGLVGLLAVVSLTGTSHAVAAPVVLGANTTGITDDSGAALDAFAARSGVMPKIAMYYQDWNEGWSTALINPRFVNPIVARGAIPMITWEPNLDSGDPIDQPEYSPARIAAGAFDPYVRRAAREAAAYGQPILLRFAQEMNGAWYSWGAIPGNTPEEYIAMWRHVVSIFREEGADNVRWVWSPNVYGAGGVEPFQAYYPGNEWVDYASLDGYNWSGLKPSGWRSLAEVFESSYQAMTELTGKPLMISETATPEEGGDKAAWIREILTVLPTRMPRVRALIWFDRVKETDWRIDSSPASDLAFRELAAAPRFAGTVDELLSAPELPVVLPSSSPSPAPSAGVPVLSVSDTSTQVAPERFQAVTFPIRLSTPSRDPVQVRFFVGDAQGRKVRHKRGRIRIAPGHRHGRLRVWVRDGDSSHVRADDLVVRLFSPDGARLARRVAHGTLHLRQRAAATSR
jgi:beta-mannanase